MKLELYTAAGSLAAVAFIATYLVPAPEAAWNFETLDQNSEGFIQIEQTEDSVHVLHGTSEGLQHFQKEKEGYVPVPWRGNWSTTTIEEDDTVAYVNSEIVNDTVAVAYQVQDVGDRELVYAEYEDGWERETVDSAEESGLGVGMYAALAGEERPSIFYHVGDGNRFQLASYENGEWRIEELESDAGWHTSAGECDGELHSLYRDRDEETLNTGSYGTGWSSEALNRSTDSMTDLEFEDCEPVPVFYDSDDEKVYYGEEEVGNGRLSRVAASNGTVVYNRKGDGLILGERIGGEYRTQVLDSSDDAGRYVDVETEETPKIGYTRGSEAVYASFDTPADPSGLLFILAGVLGGIAIADLAAGGLLT